ncbi:MAG: helix-turn-helix domain-containing protein [Prevotella sp.]
MSNKYNVRKSTKQMAEYCTKINDKVIAKLKVGIINIIVKKKKYLDKDYSVKKLAADLDTNTRYIASTMRIAFDMNYASFVNKCRVEAALPILRDKKYAKLKIEEVGYMVGFSNRQPFYASFYKYYAMTPRQYRLLSRRIEAKSKVKTEANL